MPKKLDRYQVSQRYSDQESQETVSYLLIMMLNLLTDFRSIGFASFFSFPRYVGLRLLHGMKTERSLVSPGTVCGGSSKSHSQEIVACSRPLSGLRVRSVSFSIRVYRFSAQREFQPRAQRQARKHGMLWQGRGRNLLSPFATSSWIPA